MTKFRLRGSGASMSVRSILALVAALLAIPPLAATDSLRCVAGIVRVEDRAADILAACGEPSFRDVFPVAAPTAAALSADAEHWTYNFGPNRLMYVLHLRNGRLADIRSRGHGFRVSRFPRCEPTVLVDGLSKYELLSLCGEPLSRRTLGHVTPLHPGRSTDFGGAHRLQGGHPVAVFRERWVYNLGRHHLLRTLTLDDGVVSDVETGDRGFDPQTPTP